MFGFYFPAVFLLFCWLSITMELRRWWPTSHFLGNFSFKVVLLPGPVSVLAVAINSSTHQKELKPAWLYASKTIFFLSAWPNHLNIHGTFSDKPNLWMPQLRTYRRVFCQHPGVQHNRWHTTCVQNSVGRVWSTVRPPWTKLVLARPTDPATHIRGSRHQFLPHVVFVLSNVLYQLCGSAICRCDRPMWCFNHVHTSIQYCES